MKSVYVPTGEMPVILVISLVICMTPLSMGDGLRDSKGTHPKVTNEHENTKEQKWTKSSALNAQWQMPSLSHRKIANRKTSRGNWFLTHSNEIGKQLTFSHHGSSRSKGEISLIWRRSDLPLARRPYSTSFSAIQPWYDTRLYKKQLTNNKDPEVDDEPYIVLPPDNTISTKDEAFKLDEEVDSENAASPKPTNKETPTTLTTQVPITIPPQTTKPPPITTPITTPTVNTPPTTLPPPPTTKPTEKTQVIAIQAATPKPTFPNSVSNINLNLEIGDAEESSQPAQHQSVPVPPTVQSIYPSNQQEESPVQPTPQIIFASMPVASAAPQNQQPQIIIAQPRQTQQQPQVVLVPQPTSQQPQYIIAAPQTTNAQPQYVIAAPQPTQSPPAPVVYQQSLPAPAPVQGYPQPVPAPATVPPSPVYLSPGVAIATQSSPAGSPLSAAGPSQVTVSSSSPASITVNSPASTPSMGDVNNMMMPPSLMRLSSMNPILASKILSQGGLMYPSGTGGLQVPMMQNPQFPINSVWPYITAPLVQQLELAQSSPIMSSSLLSSLPQGFDPLLYNGLTGMLANAIRSALIQPQPNALVSALALAATQAQARNQPPDLLTAALTQALAQNLQQGVQPISTTKLVQALSQALSQVASTGATPGTYNSVYPPQPPPQQQQPPPPRDTQPTAPYSPIQIPPYQLIPNAQQEAPPIRDSRSDRVNKNYSVNKVGKALASALIKAAKKIANRNPRFSTERHRAYRHGNRNYGHYRARSYVPLNYPHSPDLNYKTVNRPITNRTDNDMKEYLAMFRSFWKRILPSCYLGRYHRIRKCPLINSCG